jgi:hypothetical protein
MDEAAPAHQGVHEAERLARELQASPAILEVLCSDYWSYDALKIVIERSPTGGPLEVSAFFVDSLKPGPQGPGRGSGHVIPSPRRAG